MRFTTITLAALLILATACSDEDATGQQEPAASTPTKTETNAPTPTPTFDLAAWEKESALETRDWHSSIKSTEVSGSHIVVMTSLYPKDSNKEIASRICGTYSTARMQWEQMLDVYVRASNGERLAKCGPPR